MGPGPSGDSVAIIVGAHPFPHGNASANRMLGLAKVFEAGGFRALVVNDDPRLHDTGVRSPGTVDGVQYVNLGAPSGDRRQRWQRRRSFGARTARAAREVATAADIGVVCVPSYFFTPRTRRALRRAAPTALTVVDVVERHDARQFPRGRLEPYFLRHRLTSWYARRTADRVIVISKALAEGPFRSRRPLVLPPTVQVGDFRNAAVSVRSDAPTTVAYVGSPGSKDELHGIVRAVGDLTPDERRGLRIVVGGVDRDEMARLPGLSPQALDQVDDVLEVVGRLDRAGVVTVLARSHYTVLIRDPAAGFARFGFPTKIPESLAAGCPPIVNLTSDLGDYLTDGRDSLICAGGSPDDISTVLRRAIADVRGGHHDARRSAAVETAETRFSPDAWGAEMATWLSDERLRDSARHTP